LFIHVATIKKGSNTQIHTYIPDSIREHLTLRAMLQCGDCGQKRCSDWCSNTQ